MRELLGTGVALVTPFNEDKSVDFNGLERLVNFQIENGVNYLVVLGTTGEPATLTVEEKEQVKATIIKANNGRLPLVIGIGGNNTMAVVEEIKSADLSAFCAILSVSPYYNKPTQEGTYQHFKTISEASPLPIILYNVPGRTGKNVEPKTILRLANDFKNIVAVKEAAGDLTQAMRIIQNQPKNFMVISGDDMIALPMVLAGGSGVISVIGQAYPEEFSQMIQAGLNGNSARAKELHYDLMPIIEMIFEQGNPSGIKALLNKKGLCENSLRLPLVPVDDSLAQRIEAFSDRR